MNRRAVESANVVYVLGMIILILLGVGGSFEVGLAAGNHTVTATSVQTITDVVPTTVTQVHYITSTQTIEGTSTVYTTSTSTSIVTSTLTRTTTVTAAPPILSIIIQIACTNCTPSYDGTYFFGYYENGTQSYSISSSNPSLTILVERGTQTIWSVYWDLSLYSGTLEVKATLNSGQLISDKTVTGSASISGDFSLD